METYSWELEINKWGENIEFNFLKKYYSWKLWSQFCQYYLWGNNGSFQELCQVNGASLMKDTRAEFLSYPGKEDDEDIFKMMYSNIMWD